MDHAHCREMLGELSDYLDGTASDEFCLEIERHMIGCEDCQIVVDTLRKTVFLYRELPAPVMPDGARRRLYQKLDLGQFLNEQA